MAKHKAPVDAYETPPELLVAMVLRSIEEVPGSRRASALRAIAEQYRTLHAGAPLPKWVQMLGDLAERESDAPATGGHMRTRRNRARDEYQTPPEELLASALHTFSRLPKSRRSHAIRSTAEHFRAMYSEFGLPLPEWVPMLADAADQYDQA